MIDDNMRAKARAAFGKEFMNEMKVQPLAKNGAVALQQRANARPIPTYKVGGPVKKQDGGMMTKPSAESDDVLITTQRGRKLLEEQRRREAAAERAKQAKRAAADKLLGVATQKGGGKAGCYADGGKIEDQRVAARMAAGNYKKGGKAKKDGLAVMIAIGKPVKEKATGEMYPSKKAMAKHEAAESAGMERMERMNPVKRAVGGAGKTRKGQAPIKKMDGGPIAGNETASKLDMKPAQKLAQGGAGKVRKGMMSPEGKILQAAKPKKGLGGM